MNSDRFVVNDLGTVSLKLFGSTADSYYLDSLKDGWDWALSGKETLDSFFDAFKNDEKFVGFWINVNNEPYGLLSFRPYSEDLRFVSLGIFIHKDKRARGVASLMTLTAVKAMQEMGIPMIATVQKENIRSLNMIRKLTGSQGIPVYESTKNRNAYLFGLGSDSCVAENINENCLLYMLAENTRLTSLLPRCY